MFDFDPVTKTIEIKCPQCGAINKINLVNDELAHRTKERCNAAECQRVLYEYWDTYKILIKCDGHKKWKIVTLLPKIIIEDRTDRSRQY